MLVVDYKVANDLIRTPAYVFDIDVVNERIGSIKRILGERVKICYAMKANAFLVGAVQGGVDHYEVCSPGEFRICERAKIAMDKVVLSGVYKSNDDIKAVVTNYGERLTYTAESLQQLEMIDVAARDAGVCVRLLLRVTSGNQFGIDESLLKEIIERRAEYRGVRITGIQHFSGTQRKSLSKYEEELRYVDDLLTALKTEYGFEAEELEFGPGFYIEYFQGGKPYDENELLEGFGRLLSAMHYRGAITLELGRFIAAGCGRYYTRIVDAKRNSGVNYCIVDGGVHQVNYYGQMMAMKTPYYRQLSITEESGEQEAYNVCGSLCTVNDNLMKGVRLRKVQVGDILEFSNVGAYSMTEGMSLFLSRDLPRIYCYSEADGLRLMRDRFETDVLNFESN